MSLSSTQCTVLHQLFPSLASKLGSVASFCAAGENVLFVASNQLVTKLFLASRGLTGRLPDLSRLTALTSVDLRNNSYSGDIPTRWAAFGAGLAYLNLEGNSLTGTASIGFPSHFIDTFYMNLFPST
ncbi:hypothetical protein BDR26DRAFT_227753 [Obelidium mucronatum]|nr:hypothetical protein BDR26DRAFT_227753 [Obelidium mucronatum]